MKRLITGLFVCFLYGCGQSAPTPTHSTPPGPIVQVAATQSFSAQAFSVGRVILHWDPPHALERRLPSLESPYESRRYFTFDLNGDGHPEYFIEVSEGAHDVYYAVVDGKGRLLESRADRDDIGGDRIVILSSRHHGYADIISSYSDPGGISADMWQFDGRRYRKVRTVDYSEEHKSDAFVERDPRRVLATLYDSPMSAPPDFWRTLLHSSVAR